MVEDWVFVEPARKDVLLSIGAWVDSTDFSNFPIPAFIDVFVTNIEALEVDRSATTSLNNSPTVDKDAYTRLGQRDAGRKRAVNQTLDHARQQFSPYAFSGPYSRYKVYHI